MTALRLSLTGPRRVARLVAVLLILLGGWFLAKEVLEMMEFRAWVHEVQAGQLVKPSPSAGPEETFALSMMSVVNGRLRGLLQETKPNESRQQGGLSLKSSDEQLHDPSGACASFSHVLAKCLLTAGIEVRKVGLKRGEVKAVHHVLEAKLDGHWALMDPSLHQTFRARDGHLAEAREVGQDWAFFGQQVSADYDRSFDYSGFYHTNWDRIPVVGWLVMHTPGLEAELEKRGVSVRMWFFNINRWFGGACMLVGVCFWWWGRLGERVVASAK